MEYTEADSETVPRSCFSFPRPTRTFIFSIIGEEFGFIGVITLIVLFLMILGRCVRISMRTEDLFSRYMVFGFTALITLQAALNMGVAVGLFPTTGLTLPLVSYGGSSLVSTLAAFGIILSVSRFSTRVTMKVIIAGGGTGGHVFPAISIAEEILERNSENEVLFVGTEQGIEKRILPEKGYSGRIYKLKGNRREKASPQKVMAVISILGAMLSSLRILRDFRPDAVIGVGGYASGPTLLCASMGSIPTAVCEQNSVPGLANRILSRFVARIFITFRRKQGSIFPRRKPCLPETP